MTDRITERYLGIELVAALFKGKYQGKAHSSELGKTLAHVVGDNLDDVIKKLRAAVDSPETRAEFRKDISEKHQNFLQSHRINTDNVTILDPGANYRRTPVCFSCGGGLDNQLDFACNRCGWIVCASCGACGCGHDKFAEGISVRWESKSRLRRA